MFVKSLAFTGALALVALAGASNASPAIAQSLAPAHLTSASPDVFGSVALPVRNSRYSARWARVVRSGAPPALRSLAAPSIDRNRDQQAFFVNAAVNRQISYSYDTHPSGDHWATASETFAKSAGDCEDFVIAKMQALRTLGVPAEDLYMTIGNDVAAGAVHAVLLVRNGSSFWVLDNRTDQIIRQEDYREFHPILTFSGNQTWLHGYKRGTTPAPVRALDAAMIAQSHRLPLGNSAGSIAKLRPAR